MGTLDDALIALKRQYGAEEFGSACKRAMASTRGRKSQHQSAVFDLIDLRGDAARWLADPESWEQRESNYSIGRRYADSLNPATASEIDSLTRSARRALQYREGLTAFEACALTEKGGQYSVYHYIRALEWVQSCVGGDAHEQIARDIAQVNLKIRTFELVAGHPPDGLSIMAIDRVLEENVKKSTG